MQRKMQQFVIFGILRCVNLYAPDFQCLAAIFSLRAMAHGSHQNFSEMPGQSLQYSAEIFQAALKAYKNLAICFHFR